MKTLYKEIKIKTTKQFDVIDITEQVLEVVRDSKVNAGLLVVQSPHTTASIRLNSFEQMLRQDMFKSLYRLVPMDISYSHDLFEMKTTLTPSDRSNGHAHIKAFLMGSSESIIIHDSKLMLGANQSVLFLEFDGARDRKIQVKVIGD